MANVTINTNLTRVTDDQSATTTISLDGVPNTSSTIITNRTFTVNTNCTFTKIPQISFEKTSNPESYSYSVKKNNNGSYSFTVNYLRPITTLPTTDIIEFFSTAKTTAKSSGNKIYGWNMKTTVIRTDGERRTLKIAGDPKATVKIKVTENPRIGPNANETVFVKEFIATIDNNGTYETSISFPATTLATSYRVTISENINDTFNSGLINPTIIHLHQWPLQQVKLEIIETSDTTWVLPAASVTNAFYLYSSPFGITNHNQEFSFACTHTGDISAYTATDDTNGAFSGTTMTMDTSYVTKKIQVGYTITGTNIASGTVITAVNVGGDPKVFTINNAPTSEVADGTTITFTAVFVGENFTQVDGTSSTLDLTTHPLVSTDIIYSELSYVIDNTASPNTVTISGKLAIKHGYDAGGYSYVTLNINDILKHV